MSKVREVFYLVSLLFGAISACLVFFHVVDQPTVNTWQAALVSIGGILGVAVPGVAGYNVNKQRKQGTLGATPIDQVNTGVTAIVEAHNKSVAEVQAVKDIISGAVSQVSAGVPVLGPLAELALGAEKDS